jgi:hypothetical protein
MNATIKAAKGRCPFCPAKGGEKPVFSVKAEGLTTLICGEHLWGYLHAKEEAQPVPQNGEPVVHEAS